MKTKLFTLLMTLIVIGMVIPTFAFSPDKDKGEKSKKETVNSENKTENLTPIPPPLSWTFNVVVLDPYGTCGAQGCTLVFEAFPANANCEVQSAISVASAAYVPGTSTYLMTIPDQYPCVIVRIIDHTVHGCQYSFNSNWCCECKGSGTDCRLYICP